MIRLSDLATEWAEEMADRFRRGLAAMPQEPDGGDRDDLDGDNEDEAPNPSDLEGVPCKHDPACEDHPFARAIVDVTDSAEKVIYPAGLKWAGSGKVKRTYKKPIPVSWIRSITMHQTAVSRSAEATDRSAHRCTCHFLVGPDGTVYRVHPLGTRLVAAHRFDRKPYWTANIELMGNFAGVPGGRNYGIGPQTKLPEAQVRGAMAAIGVICEEVAEAGGKVDFLWAHRQSSKNRGADPGFEVWRRVMVPAMDRYDLANDRRAHGGLPITKWEATR